jgi:septal ring factor EnvC (AmiA/AmiB activator)
LLDLDLFPPLLLGGAGLVLALVVVVLLVGRRIVRARSAAAPTDPKVRPPEARPNVRAWLAAGPSHARTLQHLVREHPQLRARAEAAERELAPLRDRIVRAEEQAEQLRQDLSERDDQLKALRKDWEDVTQRVSQVLLELLEKKHDER